MILYRVMIVDRAIISSEGILDRTIFRSVMMLDRANIFDRVVLPDRTIMSDPADFRRNDYI